MILTRGLVTLQQTSVDADGKFAFTQLTEGDYEVRIEAPGYQTYRHLAALRYPGHEEERFSVRMVLLGSRKNSRDARGHVPPEAVKFFKRGLRLTQAGKHEEAAQSYAKAVSLAPDHAEAWNNLGGEYRILRRWADAEEALRRALSLDPEAAQANLNLGMLFVAQGKLAEARENLEEALRKDPQLAPAHFLLGVVAYQQTELDPATREFQRALELDPRVAPEAKVYLGSIFAWQGKLPEAKRHLEEFLRENPTHPQAARAEQLLRKIRNFQAAEP